MTRLFTESRSTAISADFASSSSVGPPYSGGAYPNTFPESAPESVSDLLRSALYSPLNFSPSPAALLSNVADSLISPDGGSILSANFGCVTVTVKSLCVTGDVSSQPVLCSAVNVTW